MSENRLTDYLRPHAAGRDRCVARIGIDGVEHHVGPGDLLFFPPPVFHAVTALSERIKVLVICSPPYGENPAQVIRV